MKLRDYQEEMIVKIEDSFKSGHSSPCAVLPVGSGKTATGLVYLERHTTGKILWMAPRVSLIDQTWRAMPKWAPSLKDRLKVSTVQALLGDRALPDVDLCVVDEAHFFYGTIAYGAVAHAFPRRLALTATPTRADYKPVRELADDLLVGPQRRALVASGFLPPMRTLGPDAKRKTAAWKTVDLYREHCIRPDGSREKAIVFCVDVKHAQQTSDEFRMAGIRSGSVTIESSSDLSLHAAGHLDVLTNVFMISVGYDDPTVSTVIMARPFSSPTSYIQAGGRARGAFAPEVKVIDSFGSFYEWGHVDEDREFSLGDDQPIRVKGEAREQKIVVCHGCKTSYRLNVYDLRCPHCEGTSRSLTKKEANREKLLAKYVSDTDHVRFQYLQKLVIVVRKKGLPYWIPMANYMKRYGERPKVEWLEKLGMREAKPI